MHKHLRHINVRDLDLSFPISVSVGGSSEANRLSLLTSRPRNLDFTLNTGSCCLLNASYKFVKVSCCLQKWYPGACRPSPFVLFAVQSSATAPSLRFSVYCLRGRSQQTSLSQNHQHSAQYHLDDVPTENIYTLKVSETNLLPSSSRMRNRRLFVI